VCVSNRRVQVTTASAAFRISRAHRGNDTAYVRVVTVPGRLTLLGIPVKIILR
jgi:hypothetical protein